jgi:hypothetical protein
MATLVLGAVGTAIGGAFGGAILGFSGAAIGGFIGSTVGSVVDSWIVSSLAPAQRIEGARLDTLRITSATSERTELCESPSMARIFSRNGKSGRSTVEKSAGVSSERLRRATSVVGPGTGSVHAFGT